MTKKEKIKFAYLLSYTAILIVGVVFYALFQKTDASKLILIFDIIFGILGIIGFIILHNRITVYHCHNCNTDFKLNIIETVFGDDKANEGKKATCKECHIKDYYKVKRDFNNVSSSSNKHKI